MMFTHPRNTWTDPAFPITGPASDWSRIDTVVIHYTAADDLIDGDPGENADRLDDYMRSMQRAYVTQRGYSLGYCVAVDWLGGTWGIRQWDIRSAANRDHNEHTFPILMLVDGNDKATPHAVDAVNNLIYEAQLRAGRTLAVTGHGQLQNPHHPTSCPGSGLRSQISAGAFKAVAPSPKPPIPPTPSPAEDDMTFHVTYTGPATPDGAARPELLLVQGKLVGFVSPAERDACVKATSAAPWPIVNPAQYDEVVRAYRA